MTTTLRSSFATLSFATVRHDRFIITCDGSDIDDRQQQCSCHKARSNERTYRKRQRRHPELFAGLFEVRTDDDPARDSTALSHVSVTRTIVQWIIFYSTKHDKALKDPIQRE